MNNVKRVFCGHNRKVLSNPPSTSLFVERECPLEIKCMKKDIVYKAEITAKDNGEIKEYIGMTSTTFKEGFRNHLKSFNRSTYANETRLSKYVWELKKKNRPYDVKWAILKHCPAYKPGENHCSLCSTEKFFIMKANKNFLLNKRSEIFAKCLHQSKFLAGKFTPRARQTGAQKSKRAIVRARTHAQPNQE